MKQAGFIKRILKNGCAGVPHQLIAADFVTAKSIVFNNTSGYGCNHLNTHLLYI